MACPRPARCNAAAGKRARPPARRARPSILHGEAGRSCPSDDQISRESRMLSPVGHRIQAAGLQCLKAPDCGCFSRTANPRSSRYGAFPESPVTQLCPRFAAESNRCAARTRGWHPGQSDARARVRRAPAVRSRTSLKPKSCAPSPHQCELHLGSASERTKKGGGQSGQSRVM